MDNGAHGQNGLIVMLHVDMVTKFARGNVTTLNLKMEDLIAQDQTLIMSILCLSFIYKSGPFVSAEGCKYQSVHLYPEMLLHSQF